MGEPSSTAGYQTALEQPDPGRAFDGAGELQARLLCDDLNVVDCQRDAYVAAPCVDSDQETRLDRGEQGTDIEHYRDPEPDGGRLLTVDDYAYLRLLLGGNPVLGQPHDFGAARRSQVRCAAEVRSRYCRHPFRSRSNQVDVEQPGRRGPDFPDGDLARPGGGRLPRARPVFALTASGRAGQPADPPSPQPDPTGQVRGACRILSAGGRCHGRASSDEDAVSTGVRVNLHGDRRLRTGVVRG